MHQFTYEYTLGLPNTRKYCEVYTKISYGSVGRVSLCKRLSRHVTVSKAVNLTSFHPPSLLLFAFFVCLSSLLVQRRVENVQG